MAMEFQEIVDFADSFPTRLNAEEAKFFQAYNERTYRDVLKQIRALARDIDQYKITISIASDYSSADRLSYMNKLDRVRDQINAVLKYRTDRLNEGKAHFQRKLSVRRAANRTTVPSRSQARPSEEAIQAYRARMTDRGFNYPVFVGGLVGLGGILALYLVARRKKS